MFIKRNKKTVGKKAYSSVLLVEGVRDGKEVRHKTIANLTKVPKHIVDAVEDSLKGISEPKLDEFKFRSGRNYGGLYSLKKIAGRLSIESIIGKTQFAKLALILVFGRILTQGSRRHLTFWQQRQAISEIFEIESFTTDDLYAALDWLEKQQLGFERKMFSKKFKGKNSRMYLYDITSSYLEGELNELAEYGYNRDGKKNKKQIVIGLLTDEEGFPISIEVFRGNTSDQTTVPEQITKLTERFGQKDFVFVGDRGMVKKHGIEKIESQEGDCYYITAITKPQIEALLKKKVFDMSQFGEEPVEIKYNSIRYVLRKNPKRKEEIAKNRNSKIAKIMKTAESLNTELKNKRKMRSQTAIKKINKTITSLKLSKALCARIENRTIIITRDEIELEKMAKLDGCYVVKTSIMSDDLNTEEIHSSYKNLKFVEWAFRTIKTTFLELRPIFHRKANRTRALAFVAMLSYMIVFDIWKRCHSLNVPLEEIIDALDKIQTIEYEIGGQWIVTLPSVLQPLQQQILEHLQIEFPTSA